MTRQVPGQMLMCLLRCTAREDKLLKHSSSAGGFYFLHVKCIVPENIDTPPKEVVLV